MFLFLVNPKKKIKRYTSDKETIFIEILRVCILAWYSLVDMWIYHSELHKSNPAFTLILILNNVKFLKQKKNQTSKLFTRNGFKN